MKKLRVQFAHLISQVNKASKVRLMVWNASQSDTLLTHKTTIKI